MDLKMAKQITDANNGNLYLSGTEITELPDNLTVGGWLDLSGTKITELPNNLTVGGDILINWDTVTGNRTYKKLKDGDYVPHRAYVSVRCIR